MKKTAQIRKLKPSRAKHQETSLVKNLLQFFVMVPVLFLLLVGLGFWGSWVSKVNADVGINQTINFQGKVVNKSDSTNIADSTYNFTFKLYDASSGGNQLWSETQTGVQVTSGIFQVALGSVASLSGVNFNQDNLWLDITFNSETFTSRVRLTSVPTAFNSLYLDGVVATQSASGFNLAGGTSSTSTVSFTTSSSVLTIQPGNAGGLNIQSNGDNPLTLDTGGSAAFINIGTVNASSITIGSGSNQINLGLGSFTSKSTQFALGNGSAVTIETVANNSDLTLLTSGTGAVKLTSGATSGNGIVVTTNSLSTGTGLLVTSSGTITTGGNLVFLTDSNATTGKLLSVAGAGLTTGNAVNVTGGVAMTTGSLLTIGDAAFGTKFVHTASNNIGSGLNVYVDDESTNANTGGITAGLSVGTKVNTSGNGTKEIDALRVAAPTLTACATGACTWNGLVVNTATTGFVSTIAQNALNVVATGVSAGTLTGVNIAGITGGAGTETGLTVGTGWDTAISASGDVLIESKTNTAASAENTWTVKNATAGTLNSTTAIASISATAVYNGSLYVGTYNNSKAEVYRYDGASAGTFTSLNPSGVAGTLLTTSAIDGITSMAVYNGYLYVGTSKVGVGTAGKAEVYRYDGGTVFTAVNPAGGTLAATTNIASVSAMTVWNGSLYAGTCKAGAAAVYRYEGGSTWILLNSVAGTFISTAIDCVTSMVSYNNYLVVGTAKAGTAAGSFGEVYRYSGGTTWVRLSNSTTGTFTVTSSGGSNATAVNAVTAMTVFDGHLIVGVRKAGLGDVLRYEDNIAALAPVDDWARLNNAAGTMVASGTTINSVSSLAVYNGKLYAGTESTNGAEIFRYDTGDANGTPWTKVSQNTKGTIGSTGTPTTNIDMVSQLIQYNNDLWAGTYEPGKAELYNLTTITGQSFALQFHAATTQAEQNSLENLGTISFAASPSANMGNGAFLFSDGIITNSGAYDVAEDYPTRDQLIKAGDLVAIDTSEKGMVKRSSGPNSTKVIGIYSAHPGFNLSQQGSTIDGVPAIPVALVGRVFVNISAESGIIKSGDYITSSSTSGVGMKAIKAGPVIGQALEDMDSSSCPSDSDKSCTGQVLVFVSHGYFNGISQDQLAGLSGTGDLSAVQLIGDPTVPASASASVTMQEELSSSPSAQENKNGLMSFNSLQVLGLATVSADLRVRKNVLVEGILNVVDTVMANNLIVNGLSDFFGSVVYHNDVSFQKAPAFTQDTAGYAVIHKGESKVTVTFIKPYIISPVVNATMIQEPVTPTPFVSDTETLQSTILAKGYSYVITDISANGFSVVLNKEAVADVTFSWNALMVLITPSPTPVVSP